MSKICSKCGTENSESRDTCISCGEKFAETATVDNIKSKSAALKISVWSIIGMLAGIVIIFCGIHMIDDPNVYGSSPDYAAFGADFYTEIYGATRAAANNITSSARAIVKSIGYLVTSIGAFMTCYFGKTIKK